MFFGVESTDENVFLTLQEDLLDRNDDIFHFLRLIDVVGGAKSIAIDGAWGSGKTFFVKQCKMVLDAMNPISKMPEVVWDEYSTEDPVDDDFLRKKIIGSVKKVEDITGAQSYYSVYYDAWINDSDEDPLVSLVYDIAGEIDANYLFDNSIEMKNIVTDIIGIVLNRDIRLIIDDLRKENSLDYIAKKRELRVRINELLESVSREKGNRVIVFIDELDRCNPKFAIDMLERIKHYFDNENVVFIFSVNLSQLEQIVKTYYGEGFDAGKYLDRFFDLRISLPPANTDKYYMRIGLGNDRYLYEGACQAAARYFDLNLREVAKFYQTARIAAYKSTHSSRSFHGSAEQAEFFLMILLVPYLIALRMTNNNEYEKCISGNGVDELLSYTDSSDFLIKWIEGNGMERSEEKNGNVNHREIVEEVYRAVFIDDYHSSRYKKVFNMEFCQRDKNNLLKRVSCLSFDATLE